MEGRHQHRTFIKNKCRRESFKKQCLEQFKLSREIQVNKRRFGLNLAKVNVDENVIHEEVCRAHKIMIFCTYK